MMYAKLMSLGLLIAALTVTGCGDKSSSSAKPEPKKNKETLKVEEGEHVHGKGPNGGVIFDLGKFHAEFTVDHPKKECTLLILGADEKTVKTVTAKELTLNTKETKTKEGKVVAPMTIKMLPKDEKDGKASKFVGTDPGLGNVAEFEGTVFGEIDGKPSQGEFKE